MDVVSHGPLRVLGVPWRPRASAYALTVVAKATYDLRPVTSPLAEQQEDVNEADNHWNDDANRSVYAPSDTAPFKARADVLLVGDAFAPHGEPVTHVAARLVVGGVDKSIDVFGDRAGTTAQPPAPFVKMPIVYERAAACADNPVGVRVDAQSGRRASAPNLVASNGAELVGFGPIAPRWPSRARLVGRAAAAWTGGALTQPMPEGFPAAFFNVAPPDQQIERLAPDQHLVLENLSADHPLLVTSLAGLRARAFVARDGEIEELELVADTLWIDTARQIATLAFRGQLALAGPNERGRVVVVAEEADHALAWADVVRLCSANADVLPRLGDDEDSVAETAAIDPTALARSDRAAPAFLARGRAPASVRPPPQSQRPPAPAAARASKPTWFERDETKPVRMGDGDLDASHTATELPAGLADASPPWLAQQAAPPVVGMHARAPEPPQQPSTEPPRPPPREPSGIIPAPVSVVPSSSASASALVPAPALVAPPSLLAASNAAASPAAPSPQAPRPSVPAPAPDPRRIPAERAGRVEPERIELLWFEPAALGGVRSSPRWKALVESLAQKPAPLAFDDEEQPPEDPPAVRDKRDLFGVMTLAAIDLADDLDGLVEASGAPGTFTPPLALLGGELAFPFDEIETLRATLTAVAPFTASDKKLKELVETAHELLKTPWLSGSGAVVDGLLGRVRDQVASQSRGLTLAQLDAQIDRTLLEQRHYQRRTVFGEPHLRVLLSAAPGAPPLVAYLTAELAKKLPMFQRLRARLVAEVHLSQDQFEASPLALRVVALARGFTQAARRPSSR